jgi:hypothetical protein
MLYFRAQTEADGAGIAQVRNQLVETTAWLRMQSEAKRSSRPDLPCNLRFAGRFSQNAGRANPVSCKSSNGFNNLEEVLATTMSRERLRVLQGRFWEIAGRSSVRLRMLAGLAQIPLRVDMVYWPTPGARLCRREALPLRSSAPYQSGAAAGVGTSIAMQSKAPRASKCRSLVRPAGTSRRGGGLRPFGVRRKRGRTPADDPLTAAGTRLV